VRAALGVFKLCWHRCKHACSYRYNQRNIYKCGLRGGVEGHGARASLGVGAGELLGLED